MTVSQANGNPRRPLPRDCSIVGVASPQTGIDEIVYEGGGVTIGRFRCDLTQPRFRDTGPIRQAVVVFPRTSVWIRHEGSRPFVADPNVVTIYNRGQRYERFPISSVGDHCDWFGLSDALARDVAGSHSPAAAEAERPFAFERAPGRAALYARQRAFMRRAAAGRVSALEAEEEVLSIVGEVLDLAGEQAGSVPRRSRANAAARRRDLAEAARAELARAPFENRSVSDLAQLLGVSSFHLCRVFREQTGQTIHAYLVGMRLRHAIDTLSGAAGWTATGFSAVAHAAGFASHAHLVEVCRRELGMTPTALREWLG
jgi:AraC-like DNA-binding protein